MKMIKNIFMFFLLFMPIMIFAETLPSKFDLRNVDGKSYVTPFKDQGNEGLCWDYGAIAHFESRVLKENNKPYDSTAIIFSEKQTVYAAAAVITNGRRAYNKHTCQIDNGKVGNGGGFSCAVELMLDGLGAVPKTWEEENKEAIENNNSPLDSNIVYNFNNSVYEVNSTIEYPHFKTSDLSEEDKKILFNTIKENIIKYGGGAFDTDVGCHSRAMYDGKDVMIVGSASDSSSFWGAMPHSMQVIGWDDNYEYKICKHNTGYSYPPNDCPNDYFSGKGVWIVKNSWADDDENKLNSIVLVAYDTNAGYDISFFKDISKKNWDNFYQLDHNYIDRNSSEFSFRENDFIGEEVINKIKVKLLENTQYKIYYSENGDDDYKLLVDLRTEKSLIYPKYKYGNDYIGYYYFDLSDKSYHINKKTKFKVVDGYGNYVYDFRVYTNNVNKNSSLNVNKVTFDNTNNKNEISFLIDISTRYIKDNEELIFKIKDSNNNYLDNSSYSYNYNKVYANINTPRLKINRNSLENESYKVETYYNNSLLSSFKISITDGIIDYIKPITVTYDSNGGNSCSDFGVFVYTGEALGTLCSPTRDGYTFSGWYTEKEDGIKIEEDTKVEKDTIVYAHWNKEIINPKGEKTISISIYVGFIVLFILLFIFIKKIIKF